MIPESPRYVETGSPYSLLKEKAYTVNDSKVSEDSASVSQSEIITVPGYWMYQRYSPKRLVLLKLSHFVGYILELSGYMLGLILKLIGFDESFVTPFLVDPYFIVIMWGIIVSLGFLYVLSVYNYSFHVYSVITEKIGWLQVPIYLLLASFLISRCLYKVGYFFIYNIVSLILAGGIIVYLYGAVKYEDDGRYVVSRLEYLGIHVLYSMLTGWLLIELCESVIFGIYKLISTQDDELFGWSYANWSLTIMTVLFSIAVIMLYKFRDVVFAWTISFAFYGVYTDQVRTCVVQCSHTVEISSLVFATLLLFFGLIIIFFHPKSVCYLRRSESVSPANV